MIGMIYERYHTRSMKELGGLASKMPVWSTFMVFFTMASVGLPGLNGFVSEILCLMGAYQASDVWSQADAGGPAPGATGGNLGFWYAAVAGTGMIIAAMYLLYMVGRIVFGKLHEPHSHGDAHASPLPRDLNGREIGILIPLAALCLILGVYPKILTAPLKEPALDTIRIVQDGRKIQPDFGKPQPPSKHAVK
jgi:NADH-quinone oxidoreductase subunit M